MSQPAARVSDMHTCPMQTPGTPPIPHVGGPILPPGAVTTLISGFPAARVGDLCVCVGPPDSIVKGSTTVMIGGQPAARMGDTTAHGGVIAGGFPKVMIGEQGTGNGGGPAGALAVGSQPARGQRAALEAAAESGAPFCEECERARQQTPPPTLSPLRSVLRDAAVSGTAFCEECERARQAAGPPPAPGGVHPATQRAALATAAADGSAFCEECAR